MWSRNSKGQILMEVAKEKLINQLRAIPTNQGFILQIYKFNSYSVPLFNGGPQQYTPTINKKLFNGFLGYELEAALVHGEV